MIGALCLAALTAAASTDEFIFEAKSEFTFDMCPPEGSMVNYSDYYEEVVNTYLPSWRSGAVFTKILQQYRANYPNSTLTDKEIMEVLADSELKRVPRARLIEIAVRSKTPELAAALANAYAEAIESFTDEENKRRCEKAVARIHEQVEKQKRADDDLAARLLKFRMEHSVDNLEEQRAIFNKGLSTATAKVFEYEKRVMAAKEWVGILEAAQNVPEKFGELPAGVPQSSEITAAYTKLQSVKMELGKLREVYTAQHPSMVAKESEFKAVSRQFNDTVERAYKTAKSDLAHNESQLARFKQKRNELKKWIEDFRLKIVKADADLKQLEQEKKISSALYQDLLLKENQVRIAAEQGSILVRVGRPATVPTRPVRRLVR